MLRIVPAISSNLAAVQESHDTRGRVYRLFLFEATHVDPLVSVEIYGGSVDGITRTEIRDTR